MLTSTPRGRIAIPATLGAGQVYLHYAFMLFSPTKALRCIAFTPLAGAEPRAGPHAGLHAGHSLAAMPDCDSSMPQPAAPEHAPGWGMVAMHLLATAVTAWALTHGDAWLAQALLRVLRRPLVATCVDVPVRQVTAALRQRTAPRLVVVGGGVGRRGPPLALATH